MIRLGLCSVTFRKKSVEEVIGLAREAGLEAIEWGGDIHLPPETEPSRVEEIAGMCARAGLDCPSYGSYFNVLDHGPDRFGPVLDTARILRAGTVRIWPGWVKPGDLTVPALDKIVETSREVARMAEKNGIRVAFEFHKDTPTQGAGGALRLLRAVAHPNLYSYFQVLPPVNLESSVKDLELLFPSLAYLHCHYYDQGQFLPLKEGRKVWEAVCRVLARNCYQGCIYFEFLREETLKQLAEDAAVMREILTGLDSGK